MAREGSFVKIDDEGIELLHSCGAISTKAAVLLKLLRWPHTDSKGRVWVSGGVEAIANDLSVSSNTVSVSIKRLMENGALTKRRRGHMGVVAEYYVRPGILTVGTRRTAKQPNSWYKTPQPAGTPRTPLNDNGGAPLEAGPTECEHHKSPLEEALMNFHSKEHEQATE